MHLSKSMALATLLSGLFVAATAFAEQQPNSDQMAKQHFEAGLAQLDDPEGPKVEEAYREFHAAYAAVPAYKIANNIAYCALLLERDAEALEMYQLYLSQASEKDLSKAKRAQLEKDIQALRSGLVRVTLKVRPVPASLIDQRFTSKGTMVVNRYPIERGEIVLGIHPGNHRFTLSAEGLASQNWEFEAQPASAHTHDFTLVRGSDVGSSAGAVAPSPASETTVAPKNITTPTQTNQPRIAPMVYVGAIATGVFVAGAVGMGILATSKKSRFDAANDGTQVSTAESLHKDMRTFALVSDLCLGAAVLSAGATVYFYMSGNSNAAQTASRSKWNLVPTVGTSSTQISWLGSF